MLHKPPIAARKLKILLFLHSFEPGGVERVALRMALAWRDEGAEVKVLMGRLEGGRRSGAPDLAYHAYPSGRVPTKGFETIWMMICLWRHVRRDPPDVIFCAGNTYTVVAAALRLLLGSNCPPIVCKVSNVLYRRDLPPPARRAYELWLRAQHRLAARWVAMARPLEDEIAACIGAAPENIAVVDDPAISAAEAHLLADARDDAPTQPGRGRLFVSAGRLVRQKRFDLLVRAFARGGEPDDRLFILGDGPRRGSLQRLIDRLDASSRISMVGHCSDIGSWLARADCLVLASDYEGVPAVLVEALASGLPIVATRSSPWVEEVLAGGRCGRLVECRDEQALASAIASFAPGHFCARGARVLAARHIIERGAPAYLSIFADAAASHRTAMWQRQGWAALAALRGNGMIDGEPALESD